MKTFPALAVLMAVLSFCGLTDRFTSNNSTNTQTNSTTTQNSSATGNSSSNTTAAEFEKPQPTAEQTAILEKGKDVSWDEQGIRWRIPANYRKISQERLLFNWGSPDNAFLIVNISPMAADFPAETSLKAFYDSAVTRKKNGELESVRYLEIDGVKGIEFLETPPEDKSSPRRHQFMAYRKYAGQLQLINLMLSTRGNNFDKHKDEFAAVMYSTKITHQD